MPTLHVVEQAAEIGKRGECLVVRRHGQELAVVPIGRVDHVAIYGNVQVTAQAVHLLLQYHIPLSYLSARGRLLGQLTPPLHPNALLRREQWRRVEDPEFRLGLARTVIGAKLANQRIVCGRWSRQRPSFSIREAGDDIGRLAKGIATAETIPELMGIEGSATRRLNDAIAEMVAGHFEFDHRTRRPATDPMSTLLGFCAALLESRVHAAVSLVGLDPYVGFVHGESWGQPSLVLDLMEEFRPPLVEAMAVGLVALRVVGAQHFEEHEGALLLTEGGTEAAVMYWETRLKREVRHPVLEGARPWSAWIEEQARLLSRLLLGDFDRYPAFRMER